MCSEYVKLNLAGDAPLLLEFYLKNDSKVPWVLRYSVAPVAEDIEGGVDY